MISFRGSSALQPSSRCIAAPRGPSQTNDAWLRAQIDGLADDDVPASFVVLLGGISVYDFRLRVAQSHLRSDLTPSHWSHAAMISTSNGRMNARTQILEVSLEPYEGFQIPSMHNGLQIAPLRRYANPIEYPNIAVIRVPVASSEWRDNQGAQKSILAQFADQRVVLDVTTLMLEWLAFVWCAGDAGNPLLDGHGVPSAAVIESLLAATGYDMSPGLDTSASSPEAFWQTAKWWQDYYSEMDIMQMETRYHVGDDPASRITTDDGGQTGKSGTTRGGGRSKNERGKSNRGDTADRDRSPDDQPSAKLPSEITSTVDEAALRRATALPRPSAFIKQSLTAQMFRPR